jgi:hypothetical protein
MNIQPYHKDCRALRSGCQSLLTPENRERLASEDTPFILKTHEYPFQDYFNGEFVIQPIRYPGAVFRSYYHFLQKRQQKNDAVQLEQVIRGEVNYGSWSAYHRAWNEAAAKLNSRYARLRYEEVVANKRIACERISNMTGLSYDIEAELLDFEEYREINPSLFVFGSNDGWESSFSREQMHQLWTIHGEMMQQLGYDEPDYERASDRDGA